MELMHFDRKKNTLPTSDIPSAPIRARIHAGSIFADAESISVLQKEGCYGHFFGERQELVAPHLHSNTYDVQQSASSFWGDKNLRIETLRLSIEEAAYLAFEKNLLLVFEGNDCLSKKKLWKYLCGKISITKIAVYCRLRKLGWTVRSGISFGCHYLVYRNGPESYHASAGVKIKAMFSSEEFLALNRALFNVKKALIFAEVTVPPSLDIDGPSCISQIGVELVTATTYFPEQNPGIQ